MCKSAVKGQRGRYCLKWRGKARGKLVGGLAAIITICSLLHLMHVGFYCRPLWRLLLWVLLCPELLKNTSRVLVREGNFNMRPKYPKPHLIMESNWRGSTSTEVKLVWVWAGKIEDWKMKTGNQKQTLCFRSQVPFDFAPAWQDAKKGVAATVWVFIWIFLTASFVITMRS